MSPEERLNRLERVAKLLVTSGRRTRSDLRTNINALIDAQMRHEIRFNEQFTRLSTGQAQNDVLLRELIVAQGRTEEQVKELAASHQELVASHQELATAHKELATATQDLAVSQKELVVSQKQTEEKLRTLIDIVEREKLTIWNCSVMAKRQHITNDDEMDRLEQELRDYLRTPRDSWKREPKMRLLLERNKQYKEELKRKALAEPPRANSQ